ncbi:hypothetical protein LCGC14_2483600 [marine sediment metagenome]|uniref:Doubled CXXCH motif domain-containing protein n=1 Tax=marine sediment metagenome TaxID=412755 RepID=A0A0F9E0J5_9ZZZZ
MILLALAVLSATLHPGCHAKARYRVLSFFFDGVPPPGQKRKSGGPGTPGQPRSPGAGPAQPIIASYHKPYGDSVKCANCHDANAPMKTRETTLKACRRCHAPHFQRDPSDWVHGPVAVDDCLFCHKGHESEYRSLLTAAPRELCLRCHDAGALLGRPYHRDLGKQTCSTCHDPHFAGNRLLLADGNTRLVDGPQLVLKSSLCCRRHPWLLAPVPVRRPSQDGLAGP